MDAGENSPLQPRDEYHREFQAFGGVQRHEDNGIRLLIIIINIRHQSDLFEEAIELSLIHISPQSIENPMPNGRLKSIWFKKYPMHLWAYVAK